MLLMQVLFNSRITPRVETQTPLFSHFAAPSLPSSKEHNCVDSKDGNSTVTSLHLVNKSSKRKLLKVFVRKTPKLSNAVSLIEARQRRIRKYNEDVI